MLYLLYCYLLWIIKLASYAGSPTFEIDYENNQFLKNGQPYRYISGTMHYFRVPAEYWQDRLQKLKYLGLDAVQTYVAWNFHETAKGVFNFSGDRDLFKFLSLANSTNLDVILRLGPYIDAEWDLGGLPFWLNNNSHLVRLNAMRTSNPAYFRHVIDWWSYLLPRITKYLHKNGGPIIMLQIENEYGSYPACDAVYLLGLFKTARMFLGNDTVFFTTDGDNPSMLKCGKIPGVYATIDFGTGGNVNESFATQRAVEPRGPLINSEFYVGWIDHVGFPHSKVDSKDVIKTLEQILETSNTTCVNLYVVEGGTTPGFYNGANMYWIDEQLDLKSRVKRGIFNRDDYFYGFNGHNNDTSGIGKKRLTYLPCTTSYDFDAPLNEGGDYTPKFWAIRDLISKYKSVPSGPRPSHHRQGKVWYGDVTVHPNDTLIELIIDAVQAPNNVTTKDPLTFEQLGHGWGYVLYRHIVPDLVEQPVKRTAKNRDDSIKLVINVPGIADRAQILLNDIILGTIDRTLDMYNLTFTSSDWPLPGGSTLDILVENEGRICYGPYLNDTKGILQGVFINGTRYYDWLSLPVNVDRLFPKHKDINKEETHRQLNQLQKNMKQQDTRQKARIYASLSDEETMCPPKVFRGHFVIDSKYGPEPNDTYLDTRGWHKGNVFLNGYNLGRFYNPVGPQSTLYVPGLYLKPHPQMNHIIMLELEPSPPCMNSGQKLSFIGKPRGSSSSLHDETEVVYLRVVPPPHTITSITENKESIQETETKADFQEPQSDDEAPINNSLDFGESNIDSKQDYVKEATKYEYLFKLLQKLIHIMYPYYFRTCSNYFDKIKALFM